MTLVYLALAWFLGITAVAAWDAPPWMAAAWIVTATPALLLIGVGRRGVLLAVACAVLALAGGASFARWEDQPLPDLARHTGQNVTLEGVVDGLPSPGTTTLTYTVRVERVDSGSGWEATSGGVRATVDQHRHFDSGDRVVLIGTLDEPPVFDTFDYRAYLARHGITGTLLFPETEIIDRAPRWALDRLVGSARASFQDGIERSVPEPEASLGAGILLGLDGGIPDGLEEDFRRSGLAHFVAVSGSNIELVTLVVFFALTPLLGRRWAAVPAAAMIAAYTLMAGAEAPVIRAGIMAAILLCGWFLGRHRSALAALAGAAMVMTLLSPGIALDVGFQMSVAATAGLIVFASWLRAGLAEATTRARLDGLVPATVLDVVALSLSASLAVLPIAAVTFERVSVIGPLANIIVAPVFAVAFWATAAVALLEAAWAPAGWAAGIVAFYPLTFMILVTEAAAAVPGSSIAIPGAGPTVAIAAYAVMALLAWPAYRYLPPEAPEPRRSTSAPVAHRLAGGAVTGVAVLAAFTWTLSPLRDPGELRIDFLDVGQGDAILVTTPGGDQLLVDGGPSGLVLARELGEVLPHWDRSLDAVLLTHPDADHLGGLPELGRRFSIDEVFDTGVNADTSGFEAYDSVFEERLRLRDGDTIERDGVTIEVLWPPSFMPDEAGSEAANDTSLVLLLEYGETRFLLTGDITAPAQRTLLDTAGVLDADVLHVPHHGSGNTAPEFLGAVGADVAVISAGADNRYGHPHEDTLGHLDGIRVFRTDMDGRVTIRSDGQRLRIESER